MKQDGFVQELFQMYVRQDVEMESEEVLSYVMMEFLMLLDVTVLVLML